MNRITLLSSLLRGYSKAADIGCDHALVSIKSVLKHNVKKIYALDINQGPLDNAIKNIKKHNLEDRIIPILSDGLLNLNEEVDVILISGMGANLICKILLDSLAKVKAGIKLILQANLEVEELRKFLVQHNFCITNEHSLYDKNKYYEVIECIYTEEPYYLDEFQIIFGPILLKNKNEAFIKHYKYLENYYTNQLSKINGKNSYDQLQKKINQINKALAL